MEQWTPVMIEWADAHGGDPGWQGTSNLVHEPALVVTVGMLFQDDADGITVVFNRDGDNVGGYCFIPASGILSVTELHAPGNSRKRR